MSPSTRSALVRRGGLAAVAATVVNLLLLWIGHAAGASMLVTTAGTGEPMPVGVPAVIAFTIVPMALGIGLAVLAGRTARGIRVLQAAGAVVAVGTIFMPLSASQDTATGLALAAMHVVTGVAYVAALHPAAVGSTRDEIARRS